MRIWGNANEYWKEGKNRRYVFCEVGQDRMTHFVKDCYRANVWCVELGDNANLGKIMGR